MAEGEATERSRLLDCESGRRGGDVAPRVEHLPSGKGPEVTETILELEDFSTRKLVAIMATAWVGVFFAALGKQSTTNKGSPVLVLIGTSSSILDSTITATLTTPISSEFASLSLLSWLATGYLIANTACQPLAGRLTDIFSRRTGLIYSNLFFGVGCLICGLAGSEYTVILGRVISGIGGGGLVTISSILTSDLVPLRRRGVWQGFGNVVYGAGMSFGGLIGGSINDTLGWRWAFLMQVPLIFVSGLLVAFLIDLPVKETSVSAWKRVDYSGATLLTMSLVLFLIGVNTGGNQLAWGHPVVLTVLPLSALLLVLFVYVEDKVAHEPIIPVRLLLRRTVWAACCTSAFCTMAIYVVYFYVPFYLQVSGLSATAAGLRLIPQGIAASLGSTGTGLVMKETGRYYRLNYANAAMFALGVGLLASLTFPSSDWQTYAYLIPCGVGCSGVLTITLIALIAAVDHEDQAVITSATYAFRSAGSTVGITIASAVFQNRLSQSLTESLDGIPDKDQLAARLRDDFHEISHLQSPMLQLKALESYMGAFRATFYTAFGMTVLAGLCGLFMREHKLYSNLARR